MFEDLKELNKRFEKADPSTIIKYVLTLVQRPVITTNFGPYSASLLHALSAEYKKVPVLWADTGYNMSTTYRFAQQLTAQLDLNLQIYTPQRTRAFLDHRFGDYIADEAGHQSFTRIVKIEPLERAFASHQPDAWFTNLRKGQTNFRSTLGIFSRSSSGVLKVSPFYHFSDERLKEYLYFYGLPNEQVYFDPTKIVKGKECGLHLSEL